MEIPFCFIVKLEVVESELVPADVAPTTTTTSSICHDIKKMQPTVFVERLPHVGRGVALDRSRGSRYDFRRKEKVVVDLT